MTSLCWEDTPNRAVMKMKKINSIDYGGKVIGIGLVFLALIPALLYVLNRLFASPVVQTLLYISLVIGAMIEAGFGFVLLIELRQDRIIGKYYMNNPESVKTPQQILDERRMKFKKGKD